MQKLPGAICWALLFGHNRGLPWQWNYKQNGQPELENHKVESLQGTGTESDTSILVHLWFPCQGPKSPFNSRQARHFTKPERAASSFHQTGVLTALELSVGSSEYPCEVGREIVPLLQVPTAGRAVQGSCSLVPAGLPCRQGHGTVNQICPQGLLVWKPRLYPHFPASPGQGLSLEV